MALHVTVLKKEAVTALSVKPNGFYIDATYGRGGHTAEVLAQLDRGGRLLALDKDPEAIVAARELQQQNSRLEVEHSAFSRIKKLTIKYRVEGEVDGILFDLGVSSPQLDDPARGFSFMKDGPLDMRMDNEGEISAEAWIASVSESELGDVLKRYGEERYARRIASAVIRARSESPIKTTGRLAHVVKEAHPAWEKDRHPATRVFQAIRIQINSELDELKRGLEQAREVLAPGGRLVAISFHSLEDRMVKRFIAKHVKGDDYPRGVPVRADQLAPELKKIGGPIMPTESEVNSNPRARSAVMRVAEKLNQAATINQQQSTSSDEGSELTRKQLTRKQRLKRQ